ncbi:MAG: WD40 repeat domain-containing protein [Spirochaetaceae bacterium]|nr:WD40 repeat domain-containing protein [Spirochaetaceae bacterium]
MTQEKKKIALYAGIAFFVVHFFAAARPIPPETILVPRWLASLESGRPVRAGGGAEAGEGGFDRLIPFMLGGRFGYVDAEGRFSVNRVQKDEVYLSENLWAEYEPEPARIEIRTSLDEAALAIEDPRGYPCFLDGRIFLAGAEQNALTEIDPAGNTLWTYEFAAPLTCIDAAAGMVLTGSIDGVVEVLDRAGKRVFFFEPGGSRYAVIAGCAISRDGSRLGIISGIDDQRFLLLERFGGPAGEYKVIYHEFLEDGFRRPVHISFIDEDRWIVFEREGGAGAYELSSRRGTKIALEGEMAAIDRSGGQGLFFALMSRSAERKELVGIRLPGRVIMRAPFTSGGVFLDRTGSRLIAGGGSTLAAFDLEKK